MPLVNLGFNRSNTVAAHRTLGATTAGVAVSFAAATTHAQWTITNLNASGSTTSLANAASGGQQAGYATVGGLDRASLWSGTAASRVDLHPAGSTSSYAKAINGGQRAGFAVKGGVSRASLWSGTANSRIDLSAFLPAGFTDSYGAGIPSDGVNTDAAGAGFNTLTSRIEALLWTHPTPAPGSAAIVGLAGLVVARHRRSPLAR